MRRQMLVVASRVMLVIAGIALTAAAVMSARLLPTNTAPSPPPAAEGNPTILPDMTAPNPAPTPMPALAATAPIPAATPEKLLLARIGIVAGHAGYDSGAVCDDGLTEADINAAIAAEVVRQLTTKGYQVDLLDEFDDRLTGYVADALVSVHADSCNVPGASGFKVARVTYSAIPEAEDELVECLYSGYEAATGLPRHPHSITDDMTSYHAFMEIDSLTPGAIIETGFMLEDRVLLVSRQDLVAKGIVDGIICFLEGSN
jgi:N-acetylmuramoyl-L-alanine amidase